jgi:hypothetical protein
MARVAIQLAYTMLKSPDEWRCLEELVEALGNDAPQVCRDALKFRKDTRDEFGRR